LDFCWNLAQASDASPDGMSNLISEGLRSAEGCSSSPRILPCDSNHKGTWGQSHRSGFPNYKELQKTGCRFGAQVSNRSVRKLRRIWYLCDFAIRLGEMPHCIKTFNNSDL
jgi:hypothetical protein